MNLLNHAMSNLVAESISTCRQGHSTKLPLVFFIAIAQGHFVQVLRSLLTKSGSGFLNRSVPVGGYCGNDCAQGEAAPAFGPPTCGKAA
jgi:hypothetical protein